MTNVSGIVIVQNVRADARSVSYTFPFEFCLTRSHAILVRTLPPGCRLTAIFDSCHSGSCLDLPYIYSTEGKIKEPNLLAEAGQGLLGAGMSYLRQVLFLTSCLACGLMSAEVTSAVCSRA
jgi:hypothetical protein